MKFVSDFILEQFPAWGDAVKTIEKIRELSIESGKDLMAVAEQYIEECLGCTDSPESYVEKCEINDFLWFHAEDILAAVGYEVKGGEDDD